MSDATKHCIPIDNPEQTALAIYVGHNDDMDAWDVNVFLGNFASREVAECAAACVAEFLRQEFGAEMLMTPQTGLQ
jgi:hypothetical protein